MVVAYLQVCNTILFRSVYIYHSLLIGSFV